MIEFESVSKTYRDGTHAVSDLSLVVPSGQITVFVGPSGCGKTTTLRMVNRMLEPTSGRILWDGEPLKSKRRTTLRRQMGYVIQSGGLFPHRTVLENIGTVPTLLGWSKTKTRSRAVELLDAVGLDRKLGDRYPGQLSGGQQQRVGVARALAADPLVLLMDEPFSAVDPVVRAELHEFFLDLQRELSKTIIMITHDIDEAIKLGDQVAILRVGGRLAQSGTPEELLEEPADPFVEGFVGKDRGYRALSFMPASTLEIGAVRVVRDASAVQEEGPVLVVDADAAPQGWVDPDRGQHLLRMGALFDPRTDTLRVALDSALTSPVGLAVAVNRDTGRYVGVVRADDILAQVADARAALDEPAPTEEGASGSIHSPADSTPPGPDADDPTAARSAPDVRPDPGSEPKKAGSEITQPAPHQQAGDAGSEGDERGSGEPVDQPPTARPASADGEFDESGGR
ncbi:MAG TPA: ATP-binding cassette domain-containing protein [Microlunatus sp.]|nr:ATP-binding cassette domain-containing protein [Microlunatus sp.]